MTKVPDLEIVAHGPEDMEKIAEWRRGYENNRYKKQLNEKPNGFFIFLCKVFMEGSRCHRQPPVKCEDKDCIGRKM